MASEYYPLRITRANPNTISADGNRYWLRFYQPGEDDKITYAEAAEFVDKLFDVDPCIDPDPQPGQVVEITPEKIFQSAAEVFGYDLEACRKALTGDYLGEILVIRSHPLGDANRYQLVASVGEILHRQKVAEPITIDLDISGVTSHNLEWPNLGHFSAEWLGTVIGEAGVIQPPTIKSTGNTIYWDDTATGTLRATFDTEYDRVRIKVPGKPDSGASAAGSSQNVKLLAFYHLLIFQGEMTAPLSDDSLSTAALTQLCGHMTATLANPYPMTTQLNPSSKRLSVVTGQGITEPPESDDDEYGCQDEASWLGDAAEYEKRCCHPPGNIAPETCLTHTARNPGGKAPSEAVKKQFMKDHPNGQLVGVGPAGRDDCGTITTSLDVAPGNCCLEATPLEWNFDLSAEVIAPSSSGDVYVTGGLLPVEWQVRGRGFYTNISRTLKSAITTEKRLRIYTDATACGPCYVTADDGCSVVQNQVRSTQGQWVFIKEVSGYALQSDDQWFISGAAESAVLAAGVVTSTLTSGKYKLEETIIQIGTDSTCNPLNNPNTYCDCVDALFTNAMAVPANNLGPRARDRRITTDVHTLDCFNLETCTFTDFGDPLTCTTYCWPCPPDMLISYGGSGNYNELCEFVSKRKLWEWTC